MGIEGDTSLCTEQMSQLGALYTILAIAVTNDVFLFRYDNQESLGGVKLVHSFYTPFTQMYHHSQLIMTYGQR